MKARTMPGEYSSDASNRLYSDTIPSSPPHSTSTPEPLPYTAAPSSHAENPALFIHSALTQATVNANPALKRQQQDLLILTSFPDNSTLHWRPQWFAQAPFTTATWTLHNPPNVVTERLPHISRGRHTYTRRMRLPSDPPAPYIKTWEHWQRVCDMYGIPADFLCEEQVELMQMGLPRDQYGQLCPPPAFPLYPEPQPMGAGCYVLSPGLYDSLPRKFRCVSADVEAGRGELVVVRSSGKLDVKLDEDCGVRVSMGVDHGRRIQQFRGIETCQEKYAVPRTQGMGRRWSHIPWTEEMEKSCRPLRVMVRFWNEAMDVAGDEPVRSDRS